MAKEARLENDRRELLDVLGRLDRALHSDVDLTKVLENTLNLALDVFACDRAYLLHPADPDEGFYRILMERTVPEYPGAGASKELIPLDPFTKAYIEEAVREGRPIAFGSPERPVPPLLRERFGILSQLSAIVAPRVGKPWVLGLHQCSSERIWEPREVELFEEFLRRVGDGLGTLLLLRDLQRNEEDLRITLDSIADGVIATDAAGLVTRLNPVAAALAGVDINAAQGQPIEQIITISDDSPSPFRSVLQGGKSKPYQEARLRRPGMDDVTIAISHASIRSDDDRLLGTVAVMRDISAAKFLENQLLESEKLTTLGLLASGVAHDFNNLLTVIGGTAEMMTLSSFDEQAVHENLTTILDSVDRAARLTQQMMMLTRAERKECVPVDCHAAIESVTRMLERSVDKRIAIKTRFDSEAIVVETEPVQLESALLNLGINASDAMPNGGELVFETRLTDGEPNPSDPVGGDRTVPRFVEIAVTDTGDGIPPEIQKRVFEPFFTTKRPGKGTGLGLAGVNAFVKELGGEVQVYSELGIGTTIRLNLPRSHMAPRPRLDSNQPPPRGSGGILVVDDEATLRHFVCHALEDLGYEPISVGTGREAIAELRQRGREIRLVLLDVMLPDILGLDALEQISEDSPNTPVLLTSGFTETPIRSILEGGKAAGFLPKPFSVRDLAFAIEQVLGESDKPYEVFSDESSNI